MKNSRQTNQYDKILKENLEVVIDNLMQNILGISFVISEELPDDIQHTKERKPDVLKKIIDNNGDKFILHIEFQLADEPEMVYRMAEYNIILARKYKISIRQFVIFIGSAKPQMATIYENKHLKYEFPIITFASLDYTVFLKSTNPEEIILAILADFKQEKPENILIQIIHRIEETSHGDFSLKRYFNQLRVLSQLRNLDLKLESIMDSIAKYYSEDRDFLYKRGLQKGETKAAERFVKNLIAKLTLSDKQIADIADVSLEFVKKIKQSIS